MRRRRAPKLDDLCRLAALLAAASSTCACADFKRALSIGDAGVNVESPLAPQALAASHGAFPYPNFRQVPPAPKDVRAAPAFKAAVIQETGERETLETWVAANPRTVFGTESFADRTRGAGLEQDARPPVDATAATEAYAARLRAAAAAPPPTP